MPSMLFMPTPERPRTAHTPEQQKSRLVALKLSEDTEMRGMDILADYGPVTAVRGAVYVAPRQQVEDALPALREAGVQFVLRDDLDALPKREILKLAEKPGWRTLEVDEEHTTTNAAQETDHPPRPRHKHFRLPRMPWQSSL